MGEKGRERERVRERKTRHQGRVILAPRHVTPVVDRHLEHSTKATTGDEASSTAINARLVASHRARSLAQLPPSGPVPFGRAYTHISISSRASHVACEIALRRNCIKSPQR